MDVSCYQALSCKQCAEDGALDFVIEFAFQPIVDCVERRVVAYEALVRGPNGEGAATVFQQVNSNNLYRFDQTCRTKAIATAARLGMSCRLNINFTPNAVYKPELCIRTSLCAAEEYGFPIKQIQFEVTESEEVLDRAHLVNIFKTYERLGFSTAIDDFGACYSGLDLLAEYQPDVLKLDRELISDITQYPAKQAIVRGMLLMTRELNIELLAEGVETRDEYHWLRQQGVRLFQGYYFAKPAFQALVTVPDTCFD